MPDVAADARTRDIVANSIQQWLSTSTARNEGTGLLNEGVGRRRRTVDLTECIWLKRGEGTL